MRGSENGAALIVGAGLMGRWHAYCLKQLTIPVSGIVDPDVDRAVDVARIAGGAPVYRSVAEAIEGGGHRTAHVCTPLPSHVDIVSALLAAQIHVIAEKPLTASCEDAERLFEKAGRANLVLCPVHQFLFESGFLRLQRELCKAGTIRQIDTVASSAGAAHGGLDLAEAVMGDILPHPLSLMRRMLGPTFAATEWSVLGSDPGEMRASAVCGGVGLGILISMAARPTRNTLRVMCERGTIHVDLFHGFAVKESPSVSRWRKILRPFAAGSSSLVAASRNLLVRGMTGERAYPGLRELVARFYGAVEGACPVPISVDETLDVSRLRDRILSQRP